MLWRGEAGLGRQARSGMAGSGKVGHGRANTVTGVTMANEAVTLVTKDATLDDLSLSDYRDMVQELRGSLSLDKLIEALGSQYSKPLWAKVEKGEIAPNRNQRNELRRYFKRPVLPPTVADATAAASPDAAVWQVGDGAAEHVIMVTTHRPITLHVNGAVTIADDEPQQVRSDDVTAVTRAVAPRRYYARPTASAAQNERRVRLGAKWADVLEAGLLALENGITHNG